MCVDVCVCVCVCVCVHAQSERWYLSPPRFSRLRALSFPVSQYLLEQAAERSWARSAGPAIPATPATVVRPPSSEPECTQACVNVCACARACLNAHWVCVEGETEGGRDRGREGGCVRAQLCRSCPHKRTKTSEAPARHTLRLMYMHHIACFHIHVIIHTCIHTHTHTHTHACMYTCVTHDTHTASHAFTYMASYMYTHTHTHTHTHTCMYTCATHDTPHIHTPHRMHSRAFSTERVLHRIRMCSLRCIHIHAHLRRELKGGPVGTAGRQAATHTNNIQKHFQCHGERQAASR